MNIRPVSADDLPFLRKMMYEAARWNPDWPREPMEEVLAEPILLRYSQGWGRHGDGGVIAEIEGEPVGAAWYRLFAEDTPGYGFVDEKTPELSIAVVPLHRRKGIGETVLRVTGYKRGPVMQSIVIGGILVGAVLAALIEYQMMTSMVGANELYPFVTFLASSGAWLLIWVGATLAGAWTRIR